MERESILFYRTFYEVSKSLPKEEGDKFLHALLDYAFYGIEPELEGVSEQFFMLIRPQIDANNRKYENGKKGGRPKKSETGSVNGSDRDANPEKTETVKTQTETEVDSDLKTKEKPKKNQTKTKKKPNENQKETKEKPNENQEHNLNETETKPNVYVNVNDNVNDNDNVNVNDNVNYSKEKHTKEKSGDFSSVCAKTIEYMNQKCGTHYDPGDAKLYSQIKGRLEEGHTLEEFKAVIDNKARDWLGSEMSRHLNPFTLFKQIKFDLYLGAAKQKDSVTKFPTQFHVGMVHDHDYTDLEQQLIEN